MRRTIAATAVAGVAALAFPARGGDAPDDDPVFRAMQDEIARAKTLSMPKLDLPYFLSAFVNDYDAWGCSASFGALTDEGGGPGASLSTNVRVGSADLDQTNFAGDFGFSFGGMGGAGAPVDRDYDALRQALWLSFDAEYKSATEAIAKKRAWLTANNVKDRQPDFAPAQTTDLLEPRLKLEVDKPKWKETVKRVSAVFRDYPGVYQCSAAMSASVAHQYFVSTDPSRHRFGEPRAFVRIWCTTQAPDGMPLSLSWHAEARTAAELPDEKALVDAARALATKLDELAKAPTAEDYWGPVLFTGEAACTFFLDTVANPLSDPRQDLGNTQGGRLVDRLGRRVAARALVARDDPTQIEWKGRPLLGHFAIDDDGVLPQPITLVDAGVLKSYYMSRVPTKLIAATNGHSRAGKGSAGNLFVEPKETVPRAELEKRLLALCAEEDLEYGMVVEQFGGSGGGQQVFFGGGGGGELQLPAPAIAYRLHKDGRRELVRGATFKSAPYRILKDLTAFGDDPTLLNTTQVGQQVSVVAPSVLVEEMEMRRPREEFQKPPYSERPKFGQ